MNRPTFTIIAGSNGCGKSTLTSSSRNDFQAAPVLDPDAVAKSLQEAASVGGSDLDAGRQVLKLADELLSARQSFTVETTLSGNTYLRMASAAKARDYMVLGVFVGTASVEINIERVKARVKKGGHNIPEADQRRRYPRTLANMRRLLPVCDLVILLDNSTDAGHRIVAFGPGSSLQLISPIPAWAESLRVDHPTIP